MELNEDFNILRFFSPYKFSFKNESTGMDLKKEETTIRWYEKLDQDSQKMIKIDEWMYNILIVWYKSFLYLVRFIKLIPSFDKGIYMYWY